MIKTRDIKIFIWVLSSAFILVIVYIMNFDLCKVTASCDLDKKFPEKANIYFINNDQNRIVINAEIADSESEIETGLMWRESLEQDAGMLFVFPFESNWKFWMKNTKVPLDMIFVNKNLEIVYIVSGVKECLHEPCETYESRQMIKYVVEVNENWSNKNNIKTGNKIEVDL